LSQGALVVIGFEQCSSPASFDLSALSDGEYTFSVRAVDALGRTGPAAFAIYDLERTPVRDEFAAPTGEAIPPSRGGQAATSPDEGSPSETTAPQAGPTEGGQPALTTAPETTTGPRRARASRQRGSGQGDSGGWLNLPDDPRELWTAISESFKFPLLLLLLVILFLMIQNQIDKRDPKLALAPVYADPNMGFSAPPKHDPEADRRMWAAQRGKGRRSPLRFSF
jgi:hypothetical protein